jgi:hypothetical protein
VCCSGKDVERPTFSSRAAPGRVRADVWEHVVRSGAGHARAVCRQWREAHDGALSELLLHAEEPTCACVLQLPFRRFVGLTTLQVLSPSLLSVHALVAAGPFVTSSVHVRAFAIHPLQLVCDGVLPRRGLAAALEELAGAPTLRYVHMALCSLADDSVRALCQLEALHTLRCGPHPYHVYESWRPIARHCGMLTGLGVSCRSRACAGSAVLQCAIPCVCACTAQAARLRRRHGRWTRRATSSARAALPVHRVLPTGATGGHAGEREPFTLTLAPNLLPRWAARA